MNSYYILSILIVWLSCNVYLLDKMGYRDYLKILLCKRWRAEGKIQWIEIIPTLVFWQLHVITIYLLSFHIHEIL